MVSPKGKRVVLRMNLKVKGLLKGLRYISHVFNEEHKSEMLIGSPIDVRHVAHIGYISGDSSTQPSWMKEFKQTNGGIESDTLQAIAYNVEGTIAYNIEGINISTEGSVGSSSRGKMSKPKLGKDGKSTGSRRRKDGKPIRKKDASGEQEGNSKPKKGRRKKKVKKVVVDESSNINTSNLKNIPTRLLLHQLTIRAGSVDQLKVDPITYMSDIELSDAEGSAKSYRTVDSCWDHRDQIVEEEGEKGDLV